MRPDLSVLGSTCKPHEYWLAEPVKELCIRKTTIFY